MDLLNEWISSINDVLWSYILVTLLLGCAFWFTIRSRFVQFRMMGEMIRLLGDSPKKAGSHEKHISSFQAFAVSLASRVGTGNLAGVATAITVPCWVRRVPLSNLRWLSYISGKGKTRLWAVRRITWKKD